MKKICTLATFIFAVIFLATAFAASWTFGYTDEAGNQWNIESDTVTVDKNEGGTLEFHANFHRMFSEEGLKKLKETFSQNGDTLPDNISSEMFCLHFKEEGGNKYFCMTDSFYLDSDFKPIQEFAYLDGPIEWNSLQENSLADNLLKVAKKYI